MRRLVQHDNPEARETPILLLGALQAIDPNVDLVYVGDQTWWLGSVATGEAYHARRRKGELILSQMDALDRVMWERPSIQRNIMLGKLALQGFARIEAYRGPDPSGVVTVGMGTAFAYDTTILRDFQVRHDRWHAADRGESAMRERLAETSSDARRAAARVALQHYLETDGRAHYRAEFGNRRQFGYGGATGVGKVDRIPGLILAP